MSEFEEELGRYKKAQEEKAQEFLNSMVAKLPLFIAIGIAIWWIFYGTVEIHPTNLSLNDRIGLTVVTIILAITYCGLIADGGFGSGKRTKKYVDAENEWKIAVKNGNIYKKEIISYAKEIAKGNLYECRKANLEEIGLKYNDYFTEDGDYIGGYYKKDKTLTRTQKKVIKKCINEQIILPSIFGNISSKYFGLKKEQSLQQYRTKTTTINAIIRIVLSVVSIGMIFNFIGFNIGGIVYAFFQIILWTASGFSQRIKNFNFVIDVLIPQYEEKVLIINGYLEQQKKGIILENVSIEEKGETQNG